ncbi:hypothetical protein AB0A71_25945 [Kitasatospora aureofaciens]|uniref:hypothetical protein n=1 Tax=Kitasatospora aureofaciens TaxID=1894 RepID=UPI0033CC76FF
MHAAGIVHSVLVAERRRRPGPAEARRSPGDDRRVAVEHAASTVLAALDQVHGESVAGLLYGTGARPRRTWPNQSAGSVNAA